MDNQQLSKSEVLRSGICNLLQALPFKSEEERELTLAFIKDYGLKLPSYFVLTDSEGVSMLGGSIEGREKVVTYIADFAVATLISVLGE